MKNNVNNAILVTYLKQIMNFITQALLMCPTSIKIYVVRPQFFIQSLLFFVMQR